ncbi:MAG: hypothetical protein JO102_01825 [Elusimicrobia bacterium]|nr:hypothetical protein [Elusimicrobiota bacterium]
MGTLRPRRSAGLVFIVASAFWLAVVWRLGAGRLASIPRPGKLPFTFAWWEAVPVAKHLLLGQANAGDYLAGRAYASYTPLFFLIMYALMAPWKHIAGIPYDVVHNFVVFYFIAAFGGLLLFWNRHRMPGLRGPGRFRDAGVLFALAGVVVTHPPIWLGLLGFNPDNFYLFVTLVFCHLLLGGGIAHFAEWGAFVALVVPLHAPAWALIGAAQRIRGWARTAAAVLALAAFSYFLPAAIVRLAGYKSLSSGFLFRSGLDGNTSYLSNLFQAFARPLVPAERMWFFSLYILAPIAVGGWVARLDSEAGRAYFRLAFSLSIPYACVLILFPQAVSIHPYLMDPLLTVPATALLFRGVLEPAVLESLDGPRLAYAILAAGFMIMTNLLSLAQGFQSLLPHV